MLHALGFEWLGCMRPAGAVPGTWAMSATRSQRPCPPLARRGALRYCNPCNMASDRVLRVGLVALALWNGVLLTMLFASSSSGPPAWLQEIPMAQVRSL